MRTVLDIAKAWLTRFFEVQGIDRAMALAAQAFSALIPLLIVYAAVVPRPDGKDFAGSLVDRFELKGAAAASVREAFAPASSVEAGISGLGVLLTILSALAFTRGMQRLYERSYELEAAGMRGTRSGLAWLLIVAAFASLRPLIDDVFSGGVAGVVVALALSAVLWTMTPYILLGRRLHWRTLLPGGMLAAVGVTVLGASAVIWLPEAIASSAQQYGMIGVAFALLSWLVATAVVLVVAASGGAVIAQRFQVVRP